MNFAPLWLVALVAAAVGAAAGGSVVSNHYRAEIADLRATQARDQAAAAEAARQRLRAAQARGDQLSAALTRTEATLEQRSQEASREIARRTTGRPCLNAATVRLLNRPDSPADPAPVPEAARTPAAEGGAAATDTDIAGWIDQAQRRHETCRARLGALIDWWEPAP